MTLYDFTTNTIDGQARGLSDYRGKAVLVVNVASRCGLTPHYAGLQKLYEGLAPRGLEVLGFPCNQFGAQEPGTDAEVKTFCTTRYGVTFPMFSKIEVNGSGQHPLYRWLTGENTAPEGSGDVKWNFTKFVIDRSGRLVSRFDPRTEPSSPELAAALEKVLG
jgi:glutathione peroxidase